MIFQLTETLNFSQNRQPIDLLLYGNLKLYKFKITGWEGLTADHRRLSKIAVEMLSLSECENYFKSHGIQTGQSCIKTKKPTHHIVEVIIHIHILIIHYLTHLILYFVIIKGRWR